MKKAFKYIPLLILCIWFPLLGTAVNITGSISADTSWAADSVIIEGEVIVESGARLTIAPGVTIYFRTGTNNIYGEENFNIGFLRINGILDASGTAEDSICFTRLDSTGYWGCLIINSDSTGSILRHCKIQYAGSVQNAIGTENMVGAVSIYNSHPEVIESDISGNQYSGIYAASGSNVFIKSNSITRNQGSGIHCAGSGPVISANIIYGNMDGIKCKDASPAIANCIISYNSGNGISASNSNPVIASNTFHNNEKNGIYCINANPIVINNIINKTGYTSYHAVKAINGSNPSLWFNCIYSETGNNYFTSSGSLYHEDDLNVPPEIAYVSPGLITLGPSSPCIESGFPSAIFNNPDGSRATIGHFGGNGVIPNLINHSFDNVSPGGLESTEIRLYNMRSTNLTANATIQGSEVFSWVQDDNIAEPGKYISGTLTFHPVENGLFTCSLSIAADDVIDGGTLAFSGQSGSGTYMDNTVISSNTTFTSQESPYYIKGCLSIEEGIILTIQPGSVLKFKAGDILSGSYSHPSSEIGYIRCMGSIIAEGTEQDSIIFTRDEVPFNERNNNGAWGSLYIEYLQMPSVFEHCIFEYGYKINNISGSHNAQGALSTYNCSPIIQNCRFSQNQLYGTGLSGGSAKLENCLISNNGTGVYAENGEHSIKNSLIRHNNTGLEFRQSTSLILFNSISNNDNGIILDDSDNSEIINNIIHSNGKGILAYAMSCPSIISNTLAKNASYAVMCHNGAAPSIKGTVLWGSSSPFHFGSEDNLINLSDSFIDGDTTIFSSQIADLGGVILGYNPGFEDSGDNNYSLSITSPLINKGPADTLGLGIRHMDIAGNTRIYGCAISRVDIGAYEYQGIGAIHTIITDTLQSGWNTVGFPFILSDSLIDYCVAIGDSLICYNPPGSSYIEADTLANNITYWIYLNQETKLEITGIQYAYNYLYLKPGWNLASLPISNGSLGLSGDEDIGLIYEYNNGYTPVADKILLPGKYYWIKSAAEKEYLLINE